MSHLNCKSFIQTFILPFQLLLAVAVNGLSITGAGAQAQLAAASAVINLADSHDRAAFTMVTRMKEEPMDVESVDNNKDEVCLLSLYISEQLDLKLDVLVRS